MSGELSYIQDSMVDMSVYKMFSTNELSMWNSVADSTVGKLFTSMLSVLENAVRSSNPNYEN